MPAKPLIFVGRLFLDPASIGVGVVVALIVWAFSSLKIGIGVGLGVHAALCVYTTWSRDPWDVEFTDTNGILRLKKSLQSGLTPDQALATFMEDLGRRSEYLKDWLTLEMDGLRRGKPADTDLLVSAVAVLSVKNLLE